LQLSTILRASLSNGILIKPNFRKFLIGQPTKLNPFVVQQITRGKDVGGLALDIEGVEMKRGLKKGNS
jgi:hypothetical protein